ncbi:MAG TPA: hypothetical protein V6C97_12585 [Oculatellaceae cyanobacterium]
MLNEKKQLTNLDKAHEGNQPSDKALKGETIKSKDENTLNEQQKQRDAIKSFKLTKDGQESCMIVGLTDKSGKAIVIKDERPLRRDFESAPTESLSKIPETQQVVNAKYDQVLRPDGSFDQVTSTKNSDGSTVQKTTHPDGATESISKDAEGRETERVRTHQTPLGEVIDERVQTTYNKQTGWPEATTTHYDMSGRETERTKQDAFGNSHTEKYAYDSNNRKHIAEETDLNRANGTSTDTKYDAQHHPTERTTHYSDGRPADHERWFDGPGGVTIHEKNGQIVLDSAPMIRDAGAANLAVHASENTVHTASESKTAERANSKLHDSRSGESHFANRDAVHIDDSSRAPHTAMERSKEHLLHTVEHLRAEGKISEKDFEKFKQNMDRLEDRVKQGHVDAIEAKKTYELMDKLVTEPKAVVSEKNRILLAENVLYHAAWPHRIDQGKYETCNMTTIQEHMFTRNPSKAAEIITSAALTGGFDSAGKHIKIDPQSLWPQPESLTSPPGDGKRSYATQVLNVLLVNDIVQRHTPPQYYAQLPAGHVGPPPGDATHRDPTDPNDVGERLTDGHGNEILDTHGKPQRTPGSAGETHNIAAELKRLTGDTQVIITDPSDAPGDKNVVHVSSPAQLEQVLKTHKMPMIIAIDANNPPFGGEHGGKFGSDPAWHVVTIQSYDAVHHQAHISNQWGSHDDIDVKLNALYRAIYPFVPPAPHPAPPPVPPHIPHTEAHKEAPAPSTEDPPESQFSSY